MYNSRLWKDGSLDEPNKLWKVGKQLGMSCRENEEKIIEEFGWMEDTNKEIMKKLEEGNQLESL